MSHPGCPPDHDSIIHESMGEGYFRVIRYWYCEHDQVTSNQVLDHYREGNIAGAYKEHWGTNG